MRILSDISQVAMAGTPITYKWNSDLALKFFGVKDENVKMYEAINHSRFRAVIAIGLVVTECAVWRFKEHTDLTDALNRLEAAWAGSLDLAYARPLRMEMTKDDDREVVAAPLDMILKVLGIIDTRYRKGSIHIAAPVVKQAVLAEHLLQNKKRFSSWLSETLKRTAETFPRTVEYDEKTGIYDASHEMPVPRDFFEPGFKCSEATAHEAWKEFLQALRPDENPYLRTPEEMKAEGFKGTPYVL